MSLRAHYASIPINTGRATSCFGIQLPGGCLYLLNGLSSQVRQVKIDKALIHSYSFTIRPLSEADGGGFAIEYLDLPGCISDGKTPEEATEHGYDAVRAYRLDCAKRGDALPKPSAASAQWRQRVPRGLHARLVARARQEGVSLNTLVTAMIAVGLGQRRAKDLGHRYGFDDFQKQRRAFAERGFADAFVVAVGAAGFVVAGEDGHSVYGHSFGP